MEHIFDSNGIYEVQLRVIDDEGDYCRFVKNQSLIEYTDTKKESLVEKIKFYDMKKVDLQKK